MTDTASDIHTTPNLEADILSALRRITSQDDSIILDYAYLCSQEKTLLTEHLGRGEVTILAGEDGATEITESIYPGVWRSVERDDTHKIIDEHLEVGAIPRIVRTINRSGKTEFKTPPVIQNDGIMNAPSVLNEAMAYAESWHSAMLNHVINFTRMPMTSDDMALIIHCLGKAPVAIRTKNYGACMISSTQVRHIWTVQYFNSENKMILNTLEIGDVPSAAQAAQEDFEDSAMRLENAIMMETL